MESFNVLRGREPVKTVGGNSYCAGYIKYLPDRATLYGIEFSGYDASTSTAKNPGKFEYFIFCSEAAWISYAKSQGVTIEAKVCKTAPEVANPAMYIISSGTYNPGGTAGENVITSTVVYPHTIGFQAVSYTHEPRPYSNMDAFVESNNVQYPLYLFVKFDGTPGVTELDYQLISGK